MGKFFIDRPIFAIVLAIALVLLGGISIFGLSIEQYPDITPPVVEVSASYAGADAETVNDAVAVPLSQGVMGVSDLLYLSTTSANDGSMVMQVVFDVGSDPDLDAIFTQNNVATATAQLPASVVTQGVVTQKTMTSFLLVYALHSDGRYSGEFLSNYAYLNLQNQLLKINGVGKVSIMGAGEYAMRIWIKPDLMSYYGLTLDEVRAAVLAEGGIYPAGQFGAEPAPDGTVYTYTATLPRQISTPEEFGDIVLRTTPDGDRIFLHDVADVSLGSRSYGVDSRFGDRPAALVVVYQSPGSNAVEVGARVRAEIDRLAARFPDGIGCTPIVDATQSIRAGIEDIFRTLVIALVLVILIIYLFIQDWRATLIPLVAIPVSLVGAFLLFPLLGFSINIISLLGLVLAIGLVVDDAIVVVEAAQVNIERGMTPREAAVEAMRNVSSPIVATTVVLLAVFIPVSMLGGVSGLLFRQFSVTISVAVVISSFNALTLSPALCALLLRPHEKPAKGFFAAFNRWFDRRMARYTERVAVYVKLTDFSRRRLTAMQIAARLNGMLYEEVPGAVCYAFIPPSIPGLGLASGVSLEVQDLDGRGTAYLAAQATRLIDSLRARPGIASVTTQFDAGVPQRHLSIDRALAMREGVALSDVYAAISTYMGGTYINNFNRFGRLYQTYLSAAPEYRVDRRSLGSYFVQSADGKTIPLSAFVEVRDTVGAAYVAQYNLYRSISLVVNPSPGVSSGQAMRIVQQTARDVLPADVGMAWSGVSLIETQESSGGAWVYVLALVFVFLALAALYESWGLPLSILLSVPPAVLGAVLFIWAAHLFDALFINDIYMQISLVMLIGLAAKNAILVVEYADRLFFGEGKSLVDAAVGAARLRARPILMTAFAFILGVLPLVFAHGVYATARNIMGVALVGGMLLATLMGLFLYPALYYLVARVGRFEQRRAAGQKTGIS